MASIPFVKMHGIGNDFIVIDNTSSWLSTEQITTLAPKMCCRHFGIGSDGLMLVEKGKKTEFKIRMFNPDGSLGESCGNGNRCTAIYLKENGLISESKIEVESSSGKLELEILDNNHVRVNMGQPSFETDRIGIVNHSEPKFIQEKIDLGPHDCFIGTAISMGNPHLVIFTDDINGVELEKWGPQLETHPLFSKKTNVHFVQVLDNQNIIQKTWERGAGITLACGSGACACIVASSTLNLTNNDVHVKLPGGNLRIEYIVNAGVYMTGPAETVFHGEWTLS